MTISMSPRLEMVANPDTIEPTLLRLNGEVEQLPWAKLLCRSFITQLQGVIGHYVISSKKTKL